MPNLLGLNIDGQHKCLDGFERLLYVMSKFYGQAERAISTGKLNPLLNLHIRPINLVVFQGPS